MRIGRLLAWPLGILILLVAGSATVLGWMGKRAEPVYDGERVVAGLMAPVAIDYGPHAIPTIRADSTADLLRAQGYATASERMWQMDLLRRVARGRVAELFGAEALPLDRLMRTLGLAGAAERSLSALPREARALLDAYADGVNAYRLEALHRRPLEYLLTGTEPAPWAAVDSLAIAEYMAYTLSFNAREELAFLHVAQRIGAERARELFPTGEGIPAEPLPPGLAAIELSEIGPPLDPFIDADRLSAELGLPRATPASNAWVVAGSRTADGYPLLANDPHLLASTPNIWFEQELIAPDLHATGASIPGLPLVLIGHNAHLAWGLTTTMADTQDLVIERPTDDGRAVRRPTGSEPIRERWESIPVRGADSERLRVRATSNGVILNDVLAEDRKLPQDFVTYDGPDLLALRTTIDLPDAAFAGLLALNRATTIAEARAAVGRFARVSQNFLLAHRNGRTGWQISGRLPIRVQRDGSLPVPGWLPGYRWPDYVPVADNPYWLDSDDGQLVSANHRSLPADHPVRVGRSWLAPYRAQRIVELLGRRDRLTSDDMVAIQMDRMGIEARHYQDALRKITPALRRLDGAAFADAERLLAWDGRFEPESQAAAFFVLLRRALFRALLEDELGPALDAYMAVALVAYNGLQETVRSGRSSFWDDIATPAVEGPVEIWARALRRARSELDQGPGGNAALGDLRQLGFPHAFAKLPLLGQLFSVGPLTGDGDDYTVNVRKAPAAHPERPVFIPGYRVVQTPSDWSRSRSSQPLGQSGHRFSRYRNDQLADWQAGRGHAVPWDGPPDDQRIGKLTLLPQTGGTE